jgi:DNA-directed RNA polymerase subunit RPC12/RpoP
VIAQISSFSFMFSIVFTLVFVFIIVAVIINFYRLLKRPAPKPPEESPTIVKEREIIKEIVKIRCPYCNNLYDEKYDKCPHCGGRRRSPTVRVVL